jgi:choline dehydrogenase
VGTLALRSSNPADRPLVDPNYLADPRDLGQIVQGLKIARSIAHAAPLSRVVSEELLPGPGIHDDAGLAAYVRRTTRTDWHPAGTCRMGRSDDRMSVVSAALKVFGVDGARVIDASVMPNIVSANTNAPTMAIADRGLSLLIGGIEA